MFAKIPIEPNAIYTRQETAQLLGISLSTLKQLIRTGQLKVSQPLGLRRVLIRGTGILEMLYRSEKTDWMGNDPILDSAYSSHSINSQGNSLRPKQASTRAEMAAPRKSVRASGGANR